MRRFGSDRIKMIMESTGMQDEMAIRSKMFSKSVESAQKRVEGNNFDNRKHILDYDNVVSTQRESIYNKRNEILDKESVHEDVLESMKNHVVDIVESHLDEKDNLKEEDKKDIIDYINNNLLRNKVKEKEPEGKNVDEIRLDNKDISKSLQSLAERVSAVESSTKSAHHRLDNIEDSMRK